MRFRSLDRWTVWTGVVLFVLLGTVLATFTDYGITWDEWVQTLYARHVFDWYASGFRDRDALEYLNLMYYGGFFEVITEVARRLVPIGLVPVRHLVNALFGLVGIAATAHCARSLAGPRAGFVAAISLALVPVYWGHIFNNSKDIPFAAMYVAALAAIVAVTRCLPRPGIRAWTGVGVLIGLAMGIRIGGVLLLGYVALAGASWIAFGALRPWETPARGESVRLLLGAVGVVPLVAYVVMLLCWPWAQVDPLRHPLRALRESSNFQWDGSVLFEGRYVSANALPWNYVPKWLALSLPEFVMVGLLLWAAAALAAVRAGSHRNAATAPHLIGQAVVVTSVVFPATYAAATGAVLYDGIRHFLFVVPPLVILTAVGVERLLARGSRVVTALLGGAMLLSAGDTLRQMVELHPYQSLYFNPLVAGGLRSAHGRYETDYWGFSYKEGVEWLSSNVRSGGAGRPRIASCSHPFSTSYFIPVDRFEYVGSIEFGTSAPPDILLATTRSDCHTRLPGQVVHTVSRQETPILYVIRVAEAAPPNAFPAR